MPQSVPMKWYEEWWLKSLGLGSIFGSLVYFFFNSSNLAVAVLALVFAYFFLRNPKRRFFWAATGILSAISLFNVLPLLDAQFHLSQGTEGGHIDLLFQLGIDDNTLLNSVLIVLAGFLFWLDSGKE